jgi:Protein of unknown function (DUF3631)
VTAALLDQLVVFVRRYVVVSRPQAYAIALWAAHTWAIDAAEATPYLSICSPERRSGKSRLLDVLELLVAKPLKAAGVTEAALFRSISARSPTVLMDEVDAIFGPRATNHEDLRALLNAGYRRGTPVLRCVGDGSKQRVDEFDVFCAKALAGIGELPDTIADRSIRIRLNRRAKGEEIARFRQRIATEQAASLRESLEAWAAEHVDDLSRAEPALPDELDDRAQDAVEPLLAIADLASGEWPSRGRAAFVALRVASAVAEDDSLGIRLLIDVHRVLDGQTVARISTHELIEQLAGDEEAPWGDWKGSGKSLPARTLGRLLNRYGIRSQSVWLADGNTAKGFKREQFEDAWRRYLPSYPSGPSGPAPEAGSRPFPIRQASLDLTDAKSHANPHSSCDLTDLTDGTAEPGELALLAECEELVAAGVATWAP